MEVGKVSKKGAWWFPVLAGVFMVVSAVTVLLPKIQAIIAARKDLEAKEQQLQRLVTKRQFLEGLNEAELAQQLILTNRVLPSEKPVYQAMGMLIKRAEMAQVTLNSYALTPGLVASTAADKADKNEAKAGELASLPVEFSANGGFEAVYSMLTVLDMTTPLSRITSLGLTGFGEIGTMVDSPQVEAKLTAEVYYAPPPATLGKPSEALAMMTNKEQETLMTIQAFESAGFDEVVTPAGFDEQKGNVFKF